MRVLILLTLVVCASAIARNHRQRFPNTQFCGIRTPEKCCNDRDDTCTMPIHDTVCYCDQFCAEHNSEDCCPDYEDVCGEIPPPKQPQNECIHGGRYYQLKDTVKRDCNTCTCVEYKVGGSGPTVLTWECENLACINEQSLVDAINNGRYGWSATTYDKFNGVSVQQGLKYYLGTTKPTSQVAALTPVKISSEQRTRLDRMNFDSREGNWSKYIHPAMDQGKCASSWAFSTASVAADRWSIQSEGKFLDQMSVQSMIDCSEWGGCNGGSVSDAWFYLQWTGAVSEDCYPYTSGDTRDDSGTCRNVNQMTCNDNHVHHTTQPYRIGNNEYNIMQEISKQGPVQAIMTVYPDFYLYERGIYKHSSEELRHTEHDHSITGTHSVKIIGWGVENGIKYWHCVNSWGLTWGEDGTFKIIRGENESGIEDFVVGVWARVKNHDLKDRRNRRRRRHK